MKILAPVVAFAMILLAGCGPSDAELKAAWGTTNAAPAAPNPYAGLTEFEKEHGIGPVKEPLALANVNSQLAKKGEKTFETKCYSCHRMDVKLVGPALADITARRKPEYIMNMILNPEGMIQKHPDAKKLFAQFLIPMANQNVSMDEARALLEYLRKQNPKKPS